MTWRGSTPLVLAAALAALGLAACSPSERADAASGVEASAATTEAGPVVGSLDWAIAGDWRTDAERARDVFRHPKETLEFFGVKPTDVVVELQPGGGWYTAILAPWLKAGGGRLIAAHFDPSTSEYARANVEAFKAAFIDDPDRYGAIELTVASATAPGVAPDGAADAVLTFRSVHNWMRGGFADKMFEDAFRALKPGGVFGVVEHRLPSSAEQDPAATSGYVQQAYVVQLAEAAGFVFEEASEINANLKDTADHPLGVWMLPPNLRRPEPGQPGAEGYDPATYQAIGESDRMTLRFRKPLIQP
ncbi:methyltransferase domain-containing protein [bacterium]|nr:methyltransferase domain-containing protein [bacterium]